MLPSLAVFMQLFEEVLHIVIPAAFEIYLWFESAFLFLFHLLENPSCFEVVLFV
jgi:hypothetical protein